jgi:hypothetical protein
MNSAVSSFQMSFCDSASPACRTSFIVYLNGGNSGMNRSKESADYSPKESRDPGISALFPLGVGLQFLSIPPKPVYIEPSIPTQAKIVPSRDNVYELKLDEYRLLVRKHQDALSVYDPAESERWDREHLEDNAMRLSKRTQTWS